MSLLGRLANFFRDHKLDRDLDDELRSHMEMRAEENMAEGMRPDEARMDAARRFGNPALLKETARSQDTLNWLETVWQDLRYSLRVMRKNPGFSLVAVLTLALGIGANTAIFSIVNTVLLRSLPYRDPDRLVKIVNSNPGLGLRDIGMSVIEMDDLSQRSGVFDDLSVVWPVSVNLTGAEHPERLEMVGVSPSYFSMLGTTPQIGRLFGPQDEAQGFAEAVVISDKLWQRSYGKDPNILGKRVRLDNDPYTIVGVLPPGFRHPGKTLATDVDVWASAGYRADPFPKPVRNQRFLPGVVGRLKPGLTREQAQTKLDALASALRSEYPTDYPAQARWTIAIEPLQESLVGNVRPMLLMLMGAVILIILIASVNMANLLLARASGRQKEVAVRLSLGASRRIGRCGNRAAWPASGPAACARTGPSADRGKR
jgi:predicted permease